MTSPLPLSELSVPSFVRNRSTSQSDISDLDLGPSMTTVQQQIDNSLLSNTGTILPAEPVCPGTWPISLGLHSQPTCASTLPSLSSIDLLNEPLLAEQLEANICASARMSQSIRNSEPSLCPRRSHQWARFPLENTQAFALHHPPYHHPTRAEDLSSNAVSSASASFTSENPLAGRSRRQDTFHDPRAVTAAINSGRQSRVHSHAEDLESQALSSGSMSFSHPHPLTDRRRRIDQIHPLPPAANLLPLLSSRAPRRETSSSLQRPNTKAVVEESESIDYGYGFGGHHASGVAGRPADFWVPSDEEDDAAETLLQQPDSSRPNQRLVLRHSMNLTARDHRAIHRRKSLLAEFEHTLELFPGIEIDTEAEFF